MIFYKLALQGTRSIVSIEQTTQEVASVSVTTTSLHLSVHQVYIAAPNRRIMKLFEFFVPIGDKKSLSSLDSVLGKAYLLVDLYPQEAIPSFTADEL